MNAFIQIRVMKLTPNLSYGYEMNGFCFIDIP